MPMKILLVRPGALGDTILTLPIIEAICRKHPGCELSLLGSMQYQCLLPSEVEVISFENPNWDWIFVGPVSRPSGNPAQFDLAYVILKNHKTVARNLRLAGIQTVEATSEPEGRKSIVETLCERLSLKTPPRNPCLKHHCVEKTVNRIWMAPGSGSRKKNASVNNFATICNILRSLGYSDIHVTFGEPDMWLLGEHDMEQFIKDFRTQTTQNKTLKEIMTTYCNSLIYIGNDSGVSHLAAAMDIPSIIFFKETDPLVWAPWVPFENILIIQSTRLMPLKYPAITYLTRRIVELLNRKTHN